MYYCIIKFPFSSVNDNNYTLALCLNSTSDFEAVNNILAEDTELFTRKPTQLVSGDTVYNWEGTLTGSVKATDDEREDMWTPLVCSKLSFNMACQDFPVWLMEYCNNNRARVIVYKNTPARNIEQWRGYLIAQTLNMTVVRNLLSCPLVAVDEVAMAKYMNFKATTEYATNDHWCTLFGLMEHYHDLHQSRGLSAATPGFEKLYTILNLSHTDRMLWHRSLALVDSNGDPINDLPSTLVVNLDRWLQDKEATWENCLSELCEYLGVTFAVGSYGLMVVNDAYLLTCPTDDPTVQQFVYMFGSQTVVSHSTNQYFTLSNPAKIGGNLQITAEPDRYKEVVLTSKPERWEGHEYLTEEHYKPVDEAKSVRFEWGESDTVPPSSLQEYGWHKLKYLKPLADEDDYLTIPACANGEGYVMARNGELPYVDLDSCDGVTEPEPSVADTLDFITFKEGCCVIAMGEGQIGGVDEDRMLKKYFLILNHMWCNMLGRPSHTMQTEHLADTNWVTFKPFGTMAGVHPSDKHFLSVKMAVKFIRENFPSAINTNSNTYLFLKDEGSGAVGITFATPAMIMPCESSLFDFSSRSPLNTFNASLSLWYALYFEAYIRIGNFYYNGTNWVLVGNNDTPPKCQVTMWSESNEIDHVTPDGQYVVTTANYYYNISSPYRMSNTVDRYTNSTRLLANAGGVSIHNQPLHGQLEMQILGQIRFQQSQYETVQNSVPFLLINDVEFGYTDEAEFVENDDEMTQKVVMDANSHTKETLERSLKMASPTVDGFFNNVLVYDNGKAWQNLRQVKMQGSLPLLFPPEWDLARRLSNQYGSGQLYVELETPIHYDDNVHNVCFRIQGLTETGGTFLPVKRTFDYTLERLRCKMMRLNTPGARLTGIDASFDPGAAVIYDTDSLDDLKQYLTVVASYDNGLQRTLNADEYTLTGTLTAPSSTITVSFESQTDTFTVQVTHAVPVMTGITATFVQGGATIYDTDDLTDLKQYLTVVANYSDGTTAAVSSSDYTLSGSLVAPSSTITVTYEGFTDTFTVQVTHVAPVLTGITATFTQGSATIYDTDDLTDLKQYLTVVANYSDGTTAAVSSSDYTLSGSLVAPSSTITVTYEGFTDTFTVLVTHQQVLPYDAQVEYLQGDGDAYIDTGIAGGNDTLSIEIKAYWSGFVNYAAFLGNQTTSGYNITRIIQSNGGTKLYGGINQGGAVLTENATLNAWHIILLEKNYFTLDGVRVSISNTSQSTNNSNIALFNRSVVNPYTVKRDIGLKYEYVKFMDNGVLVRDYIPVRVGTTGYLYDKVSGTLFGNIGTGNFILGNDV